jgi:hypothetical protein
MTPARRSTRNDVGRIATPAPDATRPNASVSEPSCTTRGLNPPAVTEGQDLVVESRSLRTGAYAPVDRGSYLAHREKLEATTRDAAREVVPAVVLVTLRRMRELQHGGCIILASHESLPVDLFAKSHELAPAFDSGPSKYGTIGHSWHTFRRSLT